MEEFTDNVKILINVLGYKVLEPLIQKRKNTAEVCDSDSDNNDEINNYLYLKTKEASGVGLITTVGFVVCKGSKIVETNYSSCIATNLLRLRDQYKAEGKILDTILKEDILLSSSSAVAVFILGRNASGPASWKNKDGITLKELETN